MTNMLRTMKVPPNSVNLEEARHRVFDFFRAACRSLPTVMEIYNLQEVVSISQLRSIIASEIRKNSHITNPKVPLSSVNQFALSSILTTFLFFRSNVGFSWIFFFIFCGKLTIRKREMYFLQRS